MTVPTSPAAAAAVAPSASNAITAGAVASSNSTATIGTKLNSLADLKKKAPELYEKMMQGIAMSVCRDMQHHQERLKKMMRQGNSS